MSVEPGLETGRLDLAMGSGVGDSPPDKQEVQDAALGLGPCVRGGLRCEADPFFRSEELVVVGSIGVMDCGAVKLGDGGQGLGGVATTVPGGSGDEILPSS